MNKILLFLTLLLVSVAGKSQVITASLHHGVICNMQGPLPASWDLIGDSSVKFKTSNSYKDLINTTDIDDPLPFFRREFQSYNGSAYIRTTKLGYDTTGFNTIKNEFQKTSGSNLVSDIAVGDIYIVKLRYMDDYAIVKITGIKDDGMSLGNGGNNRDSISFDYKKFKISTVTALPENNEITIAKPELYLFPNPAEDVINFKLINTNEEWYFMIQDVKGNNIYQSLSKNEYEFKHSLNGIASGTYIVTVVVGKTQKIVKRIQKI